MRIWLFLTDASYLLTEEVPKFIAKNELDWWIIWQHLDLMHADDIAVLWQTGDEAGIYAIGHLVGKRFSAGDNERFNIKYDRLLDKPILKKVLVDHPEFKNWHVLKPGQKKNPVPVSDTRWSVLQEMMGETQASSVQQQTAQVAKPMTGNKTYQRRARVALPLLVEQVKTNSTIFYSDFGPKVGASNPRTLNFVLGSVGRSLQLLSERWGETVPPIQCLVINKATGLPGEGIGWFFDKMDFATLPLKERRDIFRSKLDTVYKYPRWPEVLDALGLSPVEPDFDELIKAASQWHGSGESARHEALKHYVRDHPEIVGIASGIGTLEERLASADCLDVSFDLETEWVAVEVKPASSPLPDIFRGLFQCVKYLAVMKATLTMKSIAKEARVVLVLEGELPFQLVQLKDKLNIAVIEGVRPGR